MPFHRPFSAAVLLSLTAFLPACAPKENPSDTSVHHSDNLRLIAQYPLDIPEPSGLALSFDKKTLWAVSDANGRVYRIDLQGKTVSSFGTGLKDLEDITILDARRLAVIAERDRRIVVLDHDGKVLDEGGVDIPGDDNAGPESLTFDSGESKFYVVKEDSPGTFLTLDETFKELSRGVLTFAQDYSSIAYEPARKHLWIMSDISKALYVLNHDLKIQTVFSTGVLQQEGIAVDYHQKKIYVVSDKTEKLYIFEFEDY